MIQALLIGLAGMIGTLARYGLGTVVQRLAAGRGILFPIGTLGVNVLGCFGIGLLAHLMQERLTPPVVRLTVLIGFFGGFTTFSSFAYETLNLLQEGDWRMAALNVALQNGVGFVAVWAGSHCAEWAAR